MTTFFIADTHFGHTNIIRYCNRPFETKEEHDETIISNWNSVVSKNDHVFHLGDFGFGHPKYLHSIAQRLHGKIHLIKGNHDKNGMIKHLSFRFSTIREVYLYAGHYKGKTQRIFLSHYPHRSWQMSGRGSWHLFGHVHGNMGPHYRSFDVGVDSWNFTPISIDQVGKKIEELESLFDMNKKENYN